MQSQEFHETFETKRVFTNSDPKNGTSPITGKDIFLKNNIIRHNAIKSFGESYNTFFHVYFCRVNKYKENCGCSSRRESLSEDVQKLYKDCNFWNIDDFSQSQNGKAKTKRNFCKTWGIRGLISNKQGKETKYSRRAKPPPTWCENVTISNNNPTRNRIAETHPSSPVPSNGTDNLAINEISNLLTYLKSVGGENGKKTENWPNVYIPILEKCLHCEKEMALEKNKRMRNHKNISTKLDPNIDMFLPQPKRICKKNKYMKGFCGRMFLRQDGSTSRSCCSKKEKNTNTYITCFENIPPKSCVIHKKITFTPNKRVCKKSCSLTLSSNYMNGPKHYERNQMPCKKHLFMENMNKFLALNTLLEEKTAAEKTEILKCLANNGVCLPAAKTKSEKKIFNKVQKELRTYKKTDKQQCNDYCKSMKVDFLEPFRCKSYNILTSTMPRKQFINEDNCEPKCGRGVIKSSPVINNNNEKIYEILPPPSRRLTVKGKIRNDFIKAMGRIKLKNVQTDNGDLNLLRKCSKKDKGLWSIIKNNCRPTNRGVMASLTTPNVYNCGHSSFLNKTRQNCQCDVKKYNDNHSIIKIELTPYIYPLDEDENGNTKRLLYNNKNVRVTIGRVKVQSMWQLKYFKNLIGKSIISRHPSHIINRLPSTAIGVKRTCSLISEKPCHIDHHHNINSRENCENHVDWTKDINLPHAKLKSEVKPSEVRDTNYFVLPISQSAVDFKRLDRTASWFNTEMSSNNSQSIQLEVGENFLQNISYNLSKSIVDLNSIYPAVYFKTKSKVKCKNHISLIPLGRSSTFLNSRSFGAIGVDRDKTLPINNNRIKEKHFTTNVFVISTNTKEYRNLQERQTFTSVNGHPSKFLNTLQYSDMIQDRSYEPLNVYEAHNTNKNFFKNFELEGIDSGSTLVVSCNAKFENCFHVLETLTGVPRECCIINQATEKRIRFDCPDETRLRENRGYTELSAPKRRTRHATCIRDDDSEYSKYRVLDPVLSLENSISKFKNRIETTLKKCREKRRSYQTSPSESTSSDNLKLDNSSEIRNKGILKQHENDIIKTQKQISPAESRNKGILKMNEHGDKKDYSEISPSQLRNRSILKPHEYYIDKMDSQTSPIDDRDIRNRGIVKLPQQNMKKIHCIPPVELTDGDIVKKQERNIKKRYGHTSQMESRNRNIAKGPKHNKKEIHSQPLNLKYRDLSKLHEKDNKKKDSQNSPLDIPNKGEVKRQERDIIKEDDQTSVLNLKNRPIAKRHRHNIKKKDSQTSPLGLRNTDTAITHQHNGKLADSQTSPLNLNKDILKLKGQDVKKQDSQTSPLDLRSHYTAKLQDHDVKNRDSQTSPLDLTKRDPAISHKDDVKKRDSQTSPLDLTKKDVVKLHTDDIIRKDSQTSPLDLTKRGVVKLANEDTKKIDSQTSPINLKNTDQLDDREKPLWPKSKEYQYRQKAKFGESYETESKDNQYRPQAKYDESNEPGRKDCLYWPETKCEGSIEPECKDYEYWPTAKYLEPFESDRKDYQNRPNAKYEETFEPERKKYQNQPKAKYEETFEPERNVNQNPPKAKREVSFEPERNDNHCLAKTKCEEPFEPERNDYQYRPKAKREESFKPERKDYQYRPKSKYQESFESEGNDYQNQPQPKFEESFQPERKDYQHRPQTKNDESYKEERDDYQNPKVQHEKPFEPEAGNKSYQEWSNSEDEVSSDPDDEDNRFWPKTKCMDPEYDSCRSYSEGGYDASFGPKSKDYSCRPKMKCKESFESKCEDHWPMKRKCDKENSIIECFKRASRRRVCAQRDQFEQKRKISSCLKQPNNKRKLRGRRFRWKCKGSADNILTNLVKRSKSHFERISCNPRPIAQRPRQNPPVPPTPRIVGCRKTIECPPIQYKKKPITYEKVDYKGGNKKPALTYSDFKVFTEEELKWIISNCSDAVLKTSNIDANKDEMTSEEETMFYCDYASMFKDTPSDDCDWEGIRFQIRPNKCASKKWWCMFRTIF